MTITQKNGAESGFFLAEDDGKRMGFLSYEWASESVFAILHTVVEETYQGQGVAKSLLDSAVSFARDNGYKIMPLCPYADKVFRRDPSYSDVKSDLR